MNATETKFEIFGVLGCMADDFVDLTKPSPIATKSSSSMGNSPFLSHTRSDLFEDLPTKEESMPKFCPHEEMKTTDLEGKKSELTKAQSAIVCMAKRGDSFFFSGRAGTGKTFTLKAVIEALSDSVTFVTAMTGIAASLLPRGTTVHSFAGIGHGDGLLEQLLKRVKSNNLASSRWLKAKTLIIDEVSMLSRELFEMLDQLGRSIRKRATSPFGGMQVICCGDFFQLPPVSKTISSYCFESPSWQGMMDGKSFELLEIFRQKDSRLINLLNDIRFGEISRESHELLSSLRRDITLPSGIVPTLLVPLNSTADAINVRELEKLPPEPFKLYQASDWGEDAFVQELLPKITLFPDRLPLRIGAQVMLLKNQPSLKLWNGSRGVVIGFVNPVTEGDRYSFIEALPKGVKRPDLLPVVRFSTGQEVAVSIDSYELEGLGKQRVRARRAQIPLRLSWAITIHKSQGMSLDYLKVDASRSFEAGQAYVALSRARSIEGLQVLSFDERKCWCDPKVVEFYKSTLKPLNETECKAMEISIGRKSSKRKTPSAMATDWVHTEQENTPIVPNYANTTHAFKSRTADIPPLPQRTKLSG